jgi:pimeloyl-ACP methyl ester carboxylesterase
MTILSSPPEVTDHFIDLALTRLHYVKSGSGPPLIMVPATISRIEHWVGLAQFMGQKFTTYFFELPGHGKSTSFPTKFSSNLVAETVENFIDKLGFSKITLMGFSFGGILTIKTLLRLQDRVERVALIAPNISKHAVRLSPLRKWLVRRFNVLLIKPSFQRKLIALLHSPTFEQSVVSFVKKLGHVEDSVPLKKSLHKLPLSTLDVLAYQIEEVFSLEFPKLQNPFSQPLHFAMSVNDPLLDFTTTFNFLSTYFSDISSINLTFPYHQPPDHPTFKYLQAEFSKFLDGFPF